MRRFLLAVTLLSMIGCGESAPQNTAPQGGKLPASELQQEITGNSGDLVLKASAVTTIPVTIRNPMKLAWPAAGPYPVRVGYQLLADGKKVPFDGPRGDLPGDLAPGGLLKFDVTIQA